ncbi:MAG: MFS transporter [Solibacterales bacterium]|nr:MFS transporter [Bryobacterales bacterium]|tara:strand:- start:1101 stop:2336 length:1236 start_codon:yes stop_codon:yes gene_type:complete
MLVRNKVLLSMFALMVITYLDRVCIAATASAMSNELNLSLSEMGYVLSAFVLGYVLFEVPGGYLADRFGARTLLTRIVIWWSIFTALTGVAWNYTSLLLIRFLFGCGEAGAFPGTTSALSRWFPRSERGRAQAVIMIGSRLGGALAPGLVIYLMHQIGWRSVYWVFALLGIIWAIFWMRWYRNTAEEHPSIEKSELAKIQAERTPTNRAATIPWVRLLTSRNIWALCVMYSGYTFGVYFYMTWLPTYLQQGRGISQSDLGFYAALPWVAALLGNLLGGVWTDAISRRMRLRWARRIPAITGLCVSASLLVAAALLESPIMGIAALALSFGASDLILSVCWATCVDIGGQHAGTISGMMNSLGQIGGVAAPMVFGNLVESYGSWELPLIIAAGYYLVSAGMWILIDPEETVV